MTKNFIKKMIKEEVETLISDPKSSLYVFDFDDTLVTDTAKVYVVKKDGSKIPLTHTEFHHYTLKDGEHLDFEEFEEVGEPHIHKGIMGLLLKHIDNSVILTARSKAKPIEDYLKAIGIDIPEVIAVGDRGRGEDSVLRNAKRKKDWIDNAIQSHNLKYVEFWDDNLQNVYQAKKLVKKHPDVKIIVHHVKHKKN